MKVFLNCLFLVVVSFLFVSCDSATKTLRFVTGGEAGTYYAFGSVIAQHATNNTGISIVSLAGSGSQSNILALADRTAELGFCQSDVMSYAYNGTKTFAGYGKIDGFSVLGALYQEQVQIVTLKDNINSIADLKGKVVSIGASGSGVYFNAIDILETYGITEGDIIPTYQSFGDSANALKDGKIDAAFIVAGSPTTAIVDLRTSHKVKLLSLDEEHMATLIAKMPHYSRATISKDVYKTDDDIHTVAVAAVVIVRDDIPEDTVYSICADIYDNPSALGELHAKYNEVSAEFGASMLFVPYHPGAAKYFSTRKFTVRTKGAE